MDELSSEAIHSLLTSLFLSQMIGDSDQREHSQFFKSDSFSATLSVVTGY